MKSVFLDLEEWMVDYLREKILDHEAKFYTESINEINIEEIKDAEIICPFINSKFDKETIDKFTNLKIIATMSTGFDHIDTEYCKEKGIIVTNVPAYGDNTVAEHVFGLLLNLSKKIYKAYNKTRRGEFSYEGLIGFDLKGKTFGVIGTGRIGQCSIRIANGFQMNVLAYDAFPKKELEKELNFKYVSLDELLGQSDVLTIHLPLLKDTFHLIDKEQVNKMKKGLILINTSRGPLINTAALLEGLNNGTIGGAGLDVLEKENLVKCEDESTVNISELPADTVKTMLENTSLMHHKNVLMTPHLAFYTKEALIRILDTTLENVYDFIENRGIKNKVN